MRVKFQSTDVPDVRLGPSTRSPREDNDPSEAKRGAPRGVGARRLTGPAGQRGSPEWGHAGYTHLSGLDTRPPTACLEGRLFGGAVGYRAGPLNLHGPSPGGSQGRTELSSLVVDSVTLLEGFGRWACWVYTRTKPIFLSNSCRGSGLLQPGDRTEKRNITIMKNLITLFSSKKLNHYLLRVNGVDTTINLRSLFDLPPR